MTTKIGVLSYKFIVQMLVKVIYLGSQTVVVAQLVRAPDCGSGGRGFESHHPPFRKPFHLEGLFLFITQRDRFRGYVDAETFRLNAVKQLQHDSI